METDIIPEEENDDQNFLQSLWDKITNREVLASGYEIGAGLTFDAATAALGWAPPVYAALNFGEGYVNNIIAQKIRGQKIDWKEALSSGVLGTVPLSQLRVAKNLRKVGLQSATETVEKVVGKTNTLQRNIVSGGILGGADVTLRSGLEGELPDPTALATGIGGGATLGGTLTPILKRTSKYVNQIVAQKKANQAESELVSKKLEIEEKIKNDPNSITPEDTRALRKAIWNVDKAKGDYETFNSFEEFEQKSSQLLYELSLKYEGIDIPIEDTIRRGSKGEVVQNPFLRIYKREDAAWISQGLQGAVPAKPTAATKWDKKMDDIYKLLTGQDPVLPTAGAKELQKIKLHTPKSSTDPKFIKHHPAPLAHIARSLDYLTDDGVRAGADYLSRKIGTPLGDFQPGTLAEEMFHSKMHRFLDDKLGSSKKGLLYKLEKKYFDDRTLKDGISLQERIDSGFMDELADVLREQKGLIDDWYRALANRAEFKKVSLEEYVNEAAETIKLNKVLREIASGKRTKGLGASDLIDRVIGLENKELRDTMKDLLQYKGIDDLLLSDEAKHLKNLNLYKAKEQFLLELMNMDWAGGKLDAGKQVLKLIDEYDLPFNRTDQNMIDDLVDALERIPIEESLDPKVAKEIKEWLGRD